MWRSAHPLNNWSKSVRCWTMHLVKVKQTWEDTKKINTINVNRILAYLNQYPPRKNQRLYGTRIYILYHNLIFQNFQICLHIDTLITLLAFQIFPICTSLVFPLILISMYHKPRLGWKIQPAKIYFRNISFFRLPERSYHSVFVFSSGHHAQITCSI